MNLIAPLVVALSLSLPPAAAPAERYGAGVTLAEVTPIRDLLQHPEAFAGKTVRIEGEVTAVCTHMGCWMTLAPAGDPTAGTIRLKVDDGVIVFPVSAKGRRAEAQGVFEPLADAPDGHEGAGGHPRATAGTAGTGSKAWQLKASGAIVH